MSGYISLSVSSTFSLYYAETSYSLGLGVDPHSCCVSWTNYESSPATHRFGREWAEHYAVRATRSIFTVPRMFDCVLFRYAFALRKAGGTRPHVCFYREGKRILWCSLLHEKMKLFRDRLPGKMFYSLFHPLVARLSTRIVFNCATTKITIILLLLFCCWNFL